MKKNAIFSATDKVIWTRSVSCSSSSYHNPGLSLITQEILFKHKFIYSQTFDPFQFINLIVPYACYQCLYWGLLTSTCRIYSCVKASSSEFCCHLRCCYLEILREMLSRFGAGIIAKNSTLVMKLFPKIYRSDINTEVKLLEVFEERKR